MGDPTTAWQLLPNGTNSARYNDSAGAAIPLGADLGLPSAIFKIPSSVYIRGLPLPSLLRPSLGESGIARGVGRGGAHGAGEGAAAPLRPSTRPRAAGPCSALTGPLGAGFRGWQPRWDRNGNWGGKTM